MRILIIHNQLWAHYKSKLFSELYNVLKQDAQTNQLHVSHIAEYESMRGGMLAQKQILYNYPYDVLFKGSLESTSVWTRFKALRKSFHRHRPQVLNITGYYDYAQVLLMFYAKWFFGVPVVISLESSAADNQRSSIKETIKSFILRQASAYFCFGTSTVAYATSLGAKPAQIAVNKGAIVDDELIKQKFQESLQNVSTIRKNFIYVGRLSKEKNLELLLKAFHRLKQTNAQAQEWGLLLVGTGPEEPTLQSLVDQLSIPDVTFTGGHPWYEVPPFFAQSSVAILPSFSEPWGLVINEAMICELPVIVSNKCGCAQDLVVEGLNGFTFDPTQEEELLAKLSYFINQQETIKTMGKESARIVAQFSVKNVAAQMVDCYQKLCRTT
jgi:glycosyltransferase involved in cell wall biosynthesis